MSYSQTTCNPDCVGAICADKPFSVNKTYFRIRLIHMVIRQMMDKNVQLLILSVTHIPIRCQSHSDAAQTQYTLYHIQHANCHLKRNCKIFLQGFSELKLSSCSLLVKDHIRLEQNLNYSLACGTNLFLNDSVNMKIAPNLTLYILIHK